MSLTETVSPFPSPHEQSHSNEGGNLSIEGYMVNRSWRKGDRIQKVEWKDTKLEHVSPLKHQMKDPLLSQYTKPQTASNTVNKYEIYFRLITRNYLGDILDFYRKYFNLDKARYANDEHYNEEKQINLKKDGILMDVVEAETSSLPSRKSNHRLPHVSTNVPHVESKKDTSYSTYKYMRKNLPTEFMSCSSDDLINLLSRLLKSLINLNDKKVPPSISNPQEASTSNNSLLTRYHSRTPPDISTHKYLSRLTKFNNFTPTSLLTTIYYIDLLSHHYQPFFTLNSWTVHRFLLVGTMLSQKLMEDFFYTNDHYAKVGGVAVSELNCLELDFLSRVDWKCVPGKQLENGRTSIRFAKDVLDLYYNQLILLMGKNTSKDDEVMYFVEQECKQSDSECSVDFKEGSDYDEESEEDEICNEVENNEKEERIDNHMHTRNEFNMNNTKNINGKGFNGQDRKEDPFQTASKQGKVQMFSRKKRRFSMTLNDDMKC